MMRQAALPVKRLFTIGPGGCPSMPDGAVYYYRIGICREPASTATGVPVPRQPFILEAVHTEPNRGIDLEVCHPPFCRCRSFLPVLSRLGAEHEAAGWI